MSPEQELLAALQTVRYQPTSRVPAHGICRAVQAQRVSPAAYRLLGPLLEKWPEGTGRADYTVPGYGMEGLHPDPAFMAYSEGCFLGCQWDQKTEYGRARMRLLVWLCEQLEGCE
jgi:hypothetical protein